MKNNSGFSLVELIVVIAIMAILAGVAVPTYTRYIAKAEDAAVVAELDVVKTAAYGAAVSAGEELKTIVVTPGKANSSGDFDQATISITTSETVTSVASYYDGGDTFAVTIDANSNYKTGAHWTPAAGWQPGIN